ncbi:DUF448 domain-containing protein [Kocuria kalidii]|uniref:YlxR family protein n=1 Tax=Kocuria kalidii TaxID=3376283 RepID=UPI003789FE8E
MRPGRARFRRRAVPGIDWSAVRPLVVPVRCRLPGPHGTSPTSRREARSAERVSADSRRTCIGCRSTEHPDQLVRVATEPTDGDPRVVVDRNGRLGGRGAWLHPSHECLDSALRRRAFRRAFRAPVDTETVAPELEALAVLTAGPATGRTSADHSRPRTAARTVRPDR